ncbi:alpha/beta-hydrolase [Viridothelium virens]|uniref:Alpha/beta-hydrolase n=1 Tax=Viridothelium virens TaxID=1048519 RepID=A0A6A6H572_VIRVR|nr:alpha/beta-hydrolase [Viridothelium virens]
MSVHYTEPSVFGSMTGSPQKPITILTHGYPESSYIWRRVTGTLSERVPLFVVDQPGYGLSTPCENGTDKLTAAGAIVDALTAVHGDGVSIILAGHDRGARTMQRLAVSIADFPQVKGLGAFLADIVPIVEEYKSFQNPADAVGYFHWSLLPRGDFATDVIMAYGGGNWVKKIFEFGSGNNSFATDLFKADNAWDIYANFFNQLSVTNASVYDYQAGATVDYDAQVADQAAGRKISMPLHILYSIYNLETLSGFNVAEIWSQWVSNGTNLTVQGIGGQRGHFIIEEAPDETITQINEFMDALGVA